VIATIIEERPWVESSQSLFDDATKQLEIMRFRLDSQMDSQTVDRARVGADQVWWKLQHTVQSLDTLTPQDVSVQSLLSLSVMSWLRLQ